jgi:hypothetical protein
LADPCGSFFSGQAERSSCDVASRRDLAYLGWQRC